MRHINLLIELVVIAAIMMGAAFLDILSKVLEFEDTYQLIWILAGVLIVKVRVEVPGRWVCGVIGHRMYLDTADAAGPATCRRCPHAEPGVAWPRSKL